MNDVEFYNKCREDEESILKIKMETKKPDAEIPKLVVYQCPYCRGWFAVEEGEQETRCPYVNGSHE